MIRFIELSDQIVDEGHDFAWFNTCSDRFEMYDEEQVWENWEEFERDYWNEYNSKPFPPSRSSWAKYLERYKSLYDGNRS